MADVGRRHAGLQASEDESISAGTALGSHRPRASLQVNEAGEGAALPHASANAPKPST